MGSPQKYKNLYYTSTGLKMLFQRCCWLHCQ